ncbi:MAG: hypothetical protein QOC82_1734 [Frankiaceae bacterium]|jgi:hypothetical protein|nr:hypothetical protein [Frankiaceae bacterium]
MTTATLSVQAVFQFDGETTTPELAAAWLAKFRQLTVATASANAPAAPMAAGTNGEDRVVAQLRRLTNATPAFRDRVERLHATLAEIGFTPTLPEPRKSNRVPSYLSYVDPVDGRNVGNINSTTFYLMRRELRDELAGQPHVAVDSRYAHVTLASDDAVDFVIDLARRLKK